MVKPDAAVRIEQAPDEMAAVPAQHHDGTENIGIEVTGLRAGEKLFEELLAASDTTIPTAHASLRIAKLNDDSQASRVMSWLLEVKANKETSDAAAIHALCDLLEEFRFRGKT